MRSAFLALSAVLIGCGPGGGAADVAYTLSQSSVDMTSSCGDLHTAENFLNDQFPEQVDPGEEPETDVTVVSTSTMNLEFRTAGDEAFMVMSGSVIPGTWNKEAKVWEFVVDESGTYEEVTAEGDFFEYTWYQEAVAVTTYSVDFKAGTLSVDVVDNYLYTEAETDEWTADEIYYSNLIIGYYYMENGGYNEPEVDDCEGDTCTIEYGQDCTSTGTATLVEVGAEADPAAE